VARPFGTTVSEGVGGSVDWTVYWFMLPVCVVVASVAMFSGISGAALLTPVFLIGLPLLGVPRLSTVAAIGTALLLETSGFGAGALRYNAGNNAASSNTWNSDQHEPTLP
jgi:hypothetical protein